MGEVNKELEEVEDKLKKLKKLLDSNKHIEAFFFSKEIKSEIYENESMWEKYFECENLKCRAEAKKRYFKDKDYVLSDITGKAHKTLEKALKKLPKYSLQLAKSFYNLGKLYFYKKNNSKALEYYYLDLNIKQKVFTKNHIRLFESYICISYCFVKKFRFDNAIKLLNKAIDIALINKDYSKVAHSSFNLGACYYYKGDYESAISHYTKSINIRENFKQKGNYQIGLTYTNIGICYNKIGDYSTAINFLNKAENVFLSTKGNYFFHICRTYTHLGIIYESMKEYIKSLRYHEKALKIKLDEYGEGSDEVVVSYTNLASVYNKLGKYNIAIKYMFSVDISKHAQHHLIVSGCYYNLGNSFYGLKKYNEALIYYQKALGVNIRIKSMYVYKIPEMEYGIKICNIVFGILKSKIDCLYEWYNEYKKNIEYLLDCCSVIQFGLLFWDNLRKSYMTENSSFYLAKQVLPILEKGIKLSIEMSEIIEHSKSTISTKKNNNSNANYFRNKVDISNLAFVLFEKTKGWWVLKNKKEILASLTVNEKNQSLFEKEKKLKTYLMSLDEEIFEMRNILKNGGDEKQIKYLVEIESKHSKEVAKYKKLIEKIHNKHHQYYTIKYDITTISIEQLQTLLQTTIDQINNQTTAVVSYFLGEKTVNTFVVTANQTEHYSFKRDSVFDETLEEYYSLLRLDNDKDNWRLFARHSHYLFQKLISSFYERLKGKKLIIIPHNELHYLPFETLITQPCNGYYHEMNFLIKEHAISYAHSATLLEQYYKSPVAEKAPKEKGVAFAPTFSPPSSMDEVSEIEEGLYEPTTRGEQKLRNAAAKLKPLLAAKVEAEWLRDTLGITAYFDKEASKEQFLKILSKNRIIHLATHTLIDDEFPMQSQILFTALRKEEGYEPLKMIELYGKKINSPLVVLSACETGIGKIEKGEGVMNLARAFFLGGCNSVFMTLWKILDDDKIVSIIQTFYNGLAKGLCKDEAMQQAKLNYIERISKQRKYEYLHPYYWAGMVGIGNMQPIEV